MTSYRIKGVAVLGGEPQDLLVDDGVLRTSYDDGSAGRVEVIDARFCKPLDGEMLSRVLRPGHAVLTVEDHSLQNGFGSAVLEHAVAHQLPMENVTRLGMPDRLVAHATRKEQLAEVGLDPAGIAGSVRDAVSRARVAVAGEIQDLPR